MSTKMKTSLVILLYMVLILGTPAAATTGMIVLRGYVPERAELIELASTDSTGIQLNESGRTLVGTIKENSTKTTGYTVEISSKNAAMNSMDTPYLMGNDPDEIIDYHILFGEEIIALDHGIGYVQNSDHTGSGNIAIAYANIQDMNEKYSDTLTLSVIAN